MAREDSSSAEALQRWDRLSAPERLRIFNETLGQTNYLPFAIDGGKGEIERDPQTRCIRMRVTSEFVGTAEWHYNERGEFRSKKDWIPGHLLGELSGDQYLKRLEPSPH